MSSTTSATPAAGAKGGSDQETPTYKGGPGKEGNPAGAGWFARITLAVICIAWVVPLVGLLITSFRGEQEANSTGWWTVFTNPGGFGFVGFDNYQLSFDRADLDNAFINSVAIALPATFIPLLVAAFAAYAFSFMRFPGRDALFLTVVALLVIPNYVAFVPILDLYNSTGMSGTFPAVWLFHIGFGMPLAVYITRNYMGADNPAIDAVIDAMLEADERDDFVAAVRALDRLLIAGRYIVPLYHAPGQWLARWSHIERPADTSLYGFDPTSAWHTGE